MFFSQDGGCPTGVRVFDCDSGGPCLVSSRDVSFALEVPALDNASFLFGIDFGKG